MASQYFYQKQIGPRRTPPPRKTSLIEINGAVPDISMLSDCLNNVRVESNEENYSESNHRFESREQETNRCFDNNLQQPPRESNFILDRELYQSRKVFDDPTTHPLQPSLHGESTSPNEIRVDGDTFEKTTHRRKSPSQNDEDFDRECIDSYQKWRAKNAELFATPENGAHGVSDMAHKIVNNNHEARINSDYKSVQLKDQSHSPEKSTLDKYYEYFRRETPNKHLDTRVKDVAVYGEKYSPHHINTNQINSNEVRFQFDPRFRISDEIEPSNYYEYHRNQPPHYKNQYQSENFIREKDVAGYVHGTRQSCDMLRACYDSRMCGKQKLHCDEGYRSHINEGPLRRRNFVEEDNLREIRDRGGSKKDTCLKSTSSRKKLKKSPALKKKRENRHDCSCPECDADDNDDEVDMMDESHVDLVKYKKSKKSSQCFSRKVDESDSSLDRFPKRSCKSSRNRNTVSFEDLCRFVKLQNEQILLIQKQVDKIGQKVDVIAQKVGKLELQNKSPVATKSGDRRKSSDNVEKWCCNCEKDKNKAQSFKLSVVKENSQIECLQAMENRNGVSIGVMTSCVEIMQKAQIEQKNVCQNKNDCGEECDNDQFNSPRSKKTGEKKKKKKKHAKQPVRSPPVNRKHHKEISAMSDSFNLNEGELQVFREPTPSPEPSIHIDIEDFSNSSSTSSGASSDEESEPNANCNSWDTNTDSDDLKMGWTLYNNIVGQVNNILQNPPPSAESHKQKAVASPEDVRKATLEQLRLLGVNLGEVDNTLSKKVTFNQQLYPREELQKEEGDPGLHLNALAKMYLQQEQFQEATNRKELADNVRGGNTNLSHATLCYLEKYKIKPGSANREKRFEVADNGPIVTDIPKPQPRRLHHNKNHHQHQHNVPQQHNYPSSRILDITKLKQQPKLL